MIRSSVPLITMALRQTPVGRAIWLASRIIRWVPDINWRPFYQYVDTLAGWTLCGTCPGPVPGGKDGELVWYTQSFVPNLPPPTQCNQANNCVTSAVPTGTWPANPRVRIRYDLYTLMGSGTRRAMIRQVWYRQANTGWIPGMPETTLKGIPYDIGYLHRFTELHSFYKPILKFAEEVKELPWLDIAHRKPDPLGNTERGYSAPPSDADESESVSRPQSFYVPRPLTRHLELRPHVRNVHFNNREKKFAGSSEAVQKFFRVVSRAKESVTEFKDFLEAFIEALPEELQKVPKKGKFATPQEMLAHIYKHWDKIDNAKLLYNLAYNYVEDKVIGAGIKAGDKFAKKVGLKATTQIRSVTLPKWRRV